MFFPLFFHPKISNKSFRSLFRVQGSRFRVWLAVVWQERRTVDSVSVSAGTRLTFTEGFKDVRRAVREDLTRDAGVKRMLFSYKRMGGAVIQQDLVLWLCSAELQDYPLKDRCLVDG